MLLLALPVAMVTLGAASPGNTSRARAAGGDARRRAAAAARGATATTSRGGGFILKMRWVLSSVVVSSVALSLRCLNDSMFFLWCLLLCWDRNPSAGRG